MIGRTCKRSNAFSRPVLMVRGLDGYFDLPCRASERRPCSAVFKVRRGPGLASFGGDSEGAHLFPFRTEQLSPSAPMVLGPRGPGRVGRRRFSSKAAPRAAFARSGPSLDCRPHVRSRNRLIVIVLIVVAGRVVLLGFLGRARARPPPAGAWERACARPTPRSQRPPPQTAAGTASHGAGRPGRPDRDAPRLGAARPPARPGGRQAGHRGGPRPLRGGERRRRRGARGPGPPGRSLDAEKVE